MTTIAHESRGRQRVGWLDALLKSRPARAARRQVKDLLWILRGARIRNPPIRGPVDSVVFVCLGNICRSPFAAELAKVRLAEAGLAVHVMSAGIRTNQAARSPELACAAAGLHGVRLDEHQPQRLTQELVDRAGLIVVMEAGQLVELRARYPQATDRIVLLSLLDSDARPGYERFNIADPFGRPRASFDDCYARIDRGLTGLIRALRPSAGGAV